MSTERTQSIVSDSYALWGTLPQGPADPPEPTPEERERARLANRITYSQLKAEYHITDDGFGLLKSHGFPDAVGRVTVRAKHGALGESVWRRDQIAKWAQDQAAVAAMMRPRK